MQSSYCECQAQNELKTPISKFSINYKVKLEWSGSKAINIFNKQEEKL